MSSEVMDLISKLRSDGYQISTDGSYIDISPADNLSAKFIHYLKVVKPEIVDALNAEKEAREHREIAVLNMLSENPKATRAVHADNTSNPKSTILTIAIRDKAICEMQIPREKCDSIQLLSLIEKYGHRTH
jgi:hypothetical protein